MGQRRGKKRKLWVSINDGTPPPRPPANKQQKRLITSPDIQPQRRVLHPVCVSPFAKSAIQRRPWTREATAASAASAASQPFGRATLGEVGQARTVTCAAREWDTNRMLPLGFGTYGQATSIPSVNVMSARRCFGVQTTQRFLFA